ncbi:MAG TPA: hypothetical protein DEA08_27480 [Planctomycetes bacterium]|nr:hypothetical protein [Planctomycetota bacterium]
MIAEDETGYVLRAVEASEGVVAREVELGLGAQRDVLDHLDADELSLFASVWGLAALVPEPMSAPPQQGLQSLVGRALGELPHGPPALLERLVARSAEALREVGRPGRATHLLPCAPSGPTRFRPLREAWLGLGPTSCTGPREWTLAARVLLGCDPWPSHPGRELVESRERPSALSVVVCAEELDLLDLDAEPAAVVLAPPDGEGWVELTWRGAEPSGEGADLLRAWALGE